MFLYIAFLVKNINFGLLDLDMDFLTLKMILSHENNTTNGLPRQNHMKVT